MLPIRSQSLPRFLITVERLVNTLSNCLTNGEVARTVMVWVDPELGRQASNEAPLIVTRLTIEKKISGSQS